MNEGLLYIWQPVSGMARNTAFKKTHHNFYERQRYNNKYVIGTLLIAEAVLLFLCMQAMLEHKPFIISTFKNWPLVVFTLMVPTLALLLIFLIEFETVINEDGIFYRWKPFGGSYKMLQLDAVKELTLIDTTILPSTWPFSKKYYEVNYLGGGVALKLMMKSGKIRVMGTRKAESLNRVLMRLAKEKYTPTTIGQNTDFSD
jgi:hypothetical protein